MRLHLAHSGIFFRFGRLTRSFRRENLVKYICAFSLPVRTARGDTNFPTRFSELLQLSGVEKRYENKCRFFGVRVGRAVCAVRLPELRRLSDNPLERPFAGGNTRQNAAARRRQRPSRFFFIQERARRSRPRSRQPLRRGGAGGVQNRPLFVKLSGMRREAYHFMEFCKSAQEEVKWKRKLTYPLRKRKRKVKAA